MSTDPYHAVQQEIETSLQTAATLRASFLRIRSMGSGREEGEELRWAGNEVRLRCISEFSPSPKTDVFHLCIAEGDARGT